MIVTVIGCASGLQWGCAAPNSMRQLAIQGSAYPDALLPAPHHCYTAHLGQAVSQLVRSRHSLFGQAHHERARNNMHTTKCPACSAQAAVSRLWLSVQPDKLGKKFGKRVNTNEQCPTSTSAPRWWRRVPHRSACVTGDANAGAAAGLRQARHHGVVVSGCAYRAVWVERPISTAPVCS